MNKWMLFIITIGMLMIIYSPNSQMSLMLMVNGILFSGIGTYMLYRKKGQ